MTTETENRDAEQRSGAGGAARFGQHSNGAGASSPHERKGEYGVLIATYGAVVGSFLAWRELSGRGLPRRIGAPDLTLLGAATHKLSRLIAKDKVATPIRAPFTGEEATTSAEQEEPPRGEGLRHTIGELVGCPYCLDMWIATGFTAALVSAPRPTRFAASILTTVAIADFLQVAYAAGQEKS